MLLKKLTQKKTYVRTMMTSSKVHTLQDLNNNNLPNASVPNASAPNAAVPSQVSLPTDMGNTQGTTLGRLETSTEKLKLEETFGKIQALQERLAGAKPRQEEISVSQNFSPPILSNYRLPNEENLAEVKHLPRVNLREDVKSSRELPQQRNVAEGRNSPKVNPREIESSSPEVPPDLDNSVSLPKANVEDQKSYLQDLLTSSKKSLQKILNPNDVYFQPPQDELSRSLKNLDTIVRSNNSSYAKNIELAKEPIAAEPPSPMGEFLERSGRALGGELQDAFGTVDKAIVECGETEKKFQSLLKKWRNLAPATPGKAWLWVAGAAVFGMVGYWALVHNKIPLVKGLFSNLTSLATPPPNDVGINASLSLPASTMNNLKEALTPSPTTEVFTGLGNLISMNSGLVVTLYIIKLLFKRF